MLLYWQRCLRLHLHHGLFARPGDCPNGTVNILWVPQGIKAQFSNNYPQSPEPPNEANQDVPGVKKSTLFYFIS